LLDRTLVAPTCRRLEARILRAGRTLALSEPTRDALDRAAGKAVVASVLPPPIDTDLFRPAPEAVVPGRVAFVGRFDDPRKNVELFLESVAEGRRRGAALTGELIGAEAPPPLLARIAALGLSGSVTCTPYLAPKPLAERLGACDIVAVTAHQEGLGIAALEAMATGCPIVATRSQGPESYVVPGENGFLASFSAVELAKRLTEVVADRELRRRLGCAARKTVEFGYSWTRFMAVLGGELDRLPIVQRERSTA
jgi:glycosyltransferase involved in cell wall biosynthesis